MNITNFDHTILLSELTLAQLVSYGLSDKLTQSDFFDDSVIRITGGFNYDEVVKLISNIGVGCSSDELFNEYHIGTDEAGRGPLLGSVVVSAVWLPTELSGRFDELDLTCSELSILNDSKKLSEKKRDALFDIIPKVAVAYATVDMPASMIDKINILQASLFGMRLAIDAVIQQVMSVLYQGVTSPDIDNKRINNAIIKCLYDGNKVPVCDNQALIDGFNSKGTIESNADVFNMTISNEEVVHEAVIKGDAIYSSIAAASVLAKVTRDQQMYQLAKQHPNYSIQKHKGYPTKAHFIALEQYGVLPDHRRSFAPVRKVLGLA